MADLLSQEEIDAMTQGTTVNYTDLPQEKLAQMLSARDADPGNLEISRRIRAMEQFNHDLEEINAGLGHALVEKSRLHKERLGALKRDLEECLETFDQESDHYQLWLSIQRIANGLKEKTP
jgi:hypothetical protein